MKHSRSTSTVSCVVFLFIPNPRWPTGVNETKSTTTQKERMQPKQKIMQSQKKMLHQKETKPNGKMAQTAKTTATMLQTQPTKSSGPLGGVGHQNK